MRVPITSFTKEDELKKIVDPSIKESIEKTIAKRKEEGKSFKTAIEEPMWLIDKDGHELKIDIRLHLHSKVSSLTRSCFHVPLRRVIPRWQIRQDCPRLMLNSRRK